ncbi:MAG: hypothetical protein H5U36_03260 [Candidatus Caldatribacterium sp.]|nr:hypothetical protein [Candidatus Caldatribacterium sp.]
MRRYSIFLWMLLFLMVPLFQALGREELLEIRIVKCVRPNLVVAAVEKGGKVEKVRVKLAGIQAPLENPEIYRQALSRLRELVEGKEAGFDFALGFSPEKSPWVGYLYLAQDEEEPCIVNAVLLCEGLVTLDEKTAGRNLLGYLLSMQEKAQEEGLGIWKKAPSKKKKTEEECPSCVIRFPEGLGRVVPQELRNVQGGQE